VHHHHPIRRRETRGYTSGALQVHVRRRQEDCWHTSGGLLKLVRGTWHVFCYPDVRSDLVADLQKCIIAIQSEEVKREGTRQETSGGLLAHVARFSDPAGMRNPCVIIFYCNASAGPGTRGSFFSYCMYSTRTLRWRRSEGIRHQEASCLAPMSGDGSQEAAYVSYVPVRYLPAGIILAEDKILWQIQRNKKMSSNGTNLQSSR
jgi:hypothetical protein